MPLCTSCKQPEHFAQGCKTLAEGPPQPSEEVTKARRAYLEAYLESEEFKRICAASLAGKKP